MPLQAEISWLMAEWEQEYEYQIQPQTILLPRVSTSERNWSLRVRVEKKAMSQGCSIFISVLSWCLALTIASDKGRTGSCPNRERADEPGCLPTLESVEERCEGLAFGSLHPPWTPGPQRVRDFSTSPAFSFHEPYPGWD